MFAVPTGPSRRRSTPLGDHARYRFATTESQRGRRQLTHDSPPTRQRRSAGQVRPKDPQWNGSDHGLVGHGIEPRGPDRGCGCGRGQPSFSARESASLPPVDAGSTRSASPSSTRGSASSSERHCRRGVPQHGHRKNVFGRSGRGRIRSTRSVSRCSDCHRPAGRWSAGCNLDPPTGCPTG